MSDETVIVRHKPKNLTPTAVNKENKRFNKKEIIEFQGEDGQVYQLEIYPHFSTSKIEKALKDYSVIISEVEKMDKQIDIANTTMTLMYLPIIKYFTTYPFPKDIKKQIDNYQAL